MYRIKTTGEEKKFINIMTWLSYVLFFLTLLLFSGCKNGPKITVCISNPEDNGFECVDENENYFHLPYEMSNGHIAIPQDDFEELVTYCKLK